MSYEAGGVDFDLTGLGVVALVAVGALAVKVISDSQKADRSGSNQQNNQLGSGPQAR